jgi:hypothetical protein
MRRSNKRPVVLLPEPLSPTSPSVSPCAILNDTSSTARTYIGGVAEHAALPREVLGQVFNFDQFIHSV